MKNEIFAKLFEIGAIQLNFEKPFTWASGIKSPIYCDFRKTISHPQLRSQLAQALSDGIKNYFPETQVIAGTATAGIPHAAWVAQILDLPLVYVRSSKKDHGTESLIEGDFKSGQSCVVVEDLISTGMSSIHTVSALRASRGEVLGIVSLFSYELQKSKRAFEENQVQAQAVLNVTDLVQFAVSTDQMHPPDEARLRDFFKSIDT